MALTVKTKILAIVLVMIIVVLSIVAVFTLTRPNSESGLYERNVRKWSVVYHPQIVSLTTPSSRRDREFACSGVILSNVWVLVGGDCVETESEWTNLEIRAGSVYWNKEGSTYKVEKLFHSHYEALTALKVYPRLTFSKYIDKVILIDKEVKWKIAYTIDWYTETMNIHEKCLIETWIPGPCVNSEQKLGEIKDNASCKLKLHGKPLITKKHVLIGFHLGYSQINQDTSKRVFLDLQEGYYAEWVRSVIKENNDVMAIKQSRKKITVCTFLNMYACQQFFSSGENIQTVKNNLDNIGRQSSINTFQKFNSSDDLLTSEKISMNPKDTSKVNERNRIDMEYSFTNYYSFNSKRITTSTVRRKVTTSESAVPRVTSLTISKEITNQITTPLATTTEEPIWDTLPLEESQFYNPV